MTGRSERGLRVLAIVLAAALPAACKKPPEPDARFCTEALVKGMDPVYGGDVYASRAMAQVYEGLLGYHYLRRPVELAPDLVTEMPEISEDGLTYTFTLRDDIVFQDDPCFPGGKGRKLVASDFVYCLKRLMGVPDSNGSWVFKGKIAGLDAWAKKSTAAMSDLYDRVNEYYPYEHAKMKPIIAEEVAGLRAVDDSTIRITLAEPFPQFLWTLAMTYAVIYPREAVEHHGIDFRNQPVGTGPYRVEEYWPFDRKILFERSPSYRPVYYPSEGAEGDEEAGLLEYAGRRLPILDRVELVMVEDAQPRWLQFATGSLEGVETEKELWAEAMIEDRLRPELAERGIWVSINEQSNTAYTAFNMDDPLLGHPGGEKAKKLRQAMSLAYDRDEWIRVMRNGYWAIPADGPVPPTMNGYVKVDNPWAGKRDVERAKELLAEAGYPGGKGLPVIEYEMSGNSTTNRYGSEILKQSMAAIGIKIQLNSNTWDQFTEKVRNKRAQTLGMAWVSDYPDAQNFLQLFYGPAESPGSNSSNFKNAEYDRLYDRMKVLQPGPERKKIIEKMTVIANEECPWIYTDWRIKYVYLHPWLKNFRWTEYWQWSFEYMDVDRAEKARRLGRPAPKPKPVPKSEPKPDPVDRAPPPVEMGK